MENKDTGLLLDKTNIELHRHYFNEMCKLIGIQVIYRAPRKDKHYDLYGELDTNYKEPMLVGCIFDEHPTQYTMKKLGWNSELQESLSLIHVPYDLPELQKGAIFIIPSGIDNAQGRVFRVTRLSTTMVYPASVTCEIGPVFTSNLEHSNIEIFENTDFNLLIDEPDERR